MTRTQLLALLILFASLSLISISSVYTAYQLPTERERIIPLCTYKQVGNYSYTAQLMPNVIYPPEKTTLKPGDKGILYARIIGNISVTFSYTFESAPPPKNITTEYRVATYLESLRWKLPYSPTPHSAPSSVITNGEFSTTFFIDVASLREIVGSISSQIGTLVSDYNFTISHGIHTTADTDVGRINEGLTPTLTIRFQYGTAEGDLISIYGLKHTKTGSIQKTEKIFLQSTINRRRVSLVMCVISFPGLAYMIWVSKKAKFRKRRKTVEEVTKEIIEPYEEIIVEVAGEPSYKDQRTIITLKKLEDLARVADDLGKPILSSRKIPTSGEKPIHAFHVLDGLIRYEYNVTAPSEIKRKQKTEEANS